MRFAAIYRDWLLSGSALGADDAALGAWLRLHVYAADLELGEGDGDVGQGRVPGCAGWGERAWLRAVGTDRAAVDAVVAAGLARWDGADLLVEGYDLQGQRAVEQKRRNGRRGGRPPKVAGSGSDNRPPTGSEPTGSGSDNRPPTGSEPSQNPLPLLSSPTTDTFTADAATPDEAQRVFGHWQNVMAKAGAKFTRDRRAKVTARLREGYTVEELCSAVDGCARSEFHMGANDRATAYNDLATILKNAQAVDSHIERINGRGPAKAAAPAHHYDRLEVSR